MKIARKGQVTIPRTPRMKFGLLPDTEAAFDEAYGCPPIRPVLGRRALIEERLHRARGIADGGSSTDAMMRLTRGEE